MPLEGHAPVSAGLDPKSGSMRLWQALLANGSSEDEATALMNGYAHELADRIRNEGAYWGQSSAAGKVYRAAAKLIDPAKDET